MNDWDKKATNVKGLPLNFANRFRHAAQRNPKCDQHVLWSSLLLEHDGC